MTDVCPGCGEDFVRLPAHLYRFPSHKPNSWPSCPTCGERYDNIGQHWAKQSCQYPELSDYQYDIVVGLLLGDGTLNNRSGRPRLRTNMITEPYLHFLDDMFGIYGTGVTLIKTAEESAERNNSFGGDDPDAYSDVYMWQTRKSPVFNQLTRWYTEDGKRFPANLELNPTRLKHWFVGDGTYVTHDNKDYILISTRNEQDQRQKVEQIVATTGFEIGWWEDGGFCLATKDTDRFFEYIGSPLPGFEYKWPDEYSQ